MDYHSAAEKKCIRCGGVLRPYAHWGICHACSPDFYAEVFPEPVVPVDPLRDKGRPYRNGVQS